MDIHHILWLFTIFPGPSYIIGENNDSQHFVEHIEGYLVHDNLLTDITRYLHTRVKSSVRYGLQNSRTNYGVYLTSIDLVQYYFLQLIHSLLVSDHIYTDFILDSYTTIDLQHYNLTTFFLTMTFPDEDIFKAVKTLSRHNENSAADLPQAIKTILVELDKKYQYFYNACRIGDIDMINWVLELGISMRKHGLRALEVAWQADQRNAVKVILENKDFPHWEINNTHALWKNKHNETLLHILAETNSTTSVIQLVVSGANIDAVDNFGKSPLYRTVEANRTEMVNLLLLRKANVFIHSQSLNSLLYVAASKGLDKIVRLLIENGLHDDTRTSIHTSLDISELMAMEIIIDHILKNCVDLSHSDNNVDLIVDWKKMRNLSKLCIVDSEMCGKNYQPERLTLLADYSSVINRLRKKGVKSNIDQGIRDKFKNAVIEAGVTEGIHFVMQFGLLSKLLEMPIKSGDLMLIQNIVQTGADVNEEMDDGLRPIHLAASLGYDKIVGFFLDRGVDVDSRTKNRRTPLYIAAAAGHVNVAKVLINRGARVHLKERNGYTAMYAAISNNQTQILQLFINSSIDLDTRFGRNNIYSPLEYASKQGLLDIVKILCENGAYMNDDSLLNNHTDIIRYFLKNGIKHKRALTAAVEKNNTQLVKALVESGADVNYSNSRQKPIHYAAKNGNVEILKILLDRGADLNKVYIHGPALYWAIMFGKEDAMKYLLSRGAEVKIDLNLLRIFLYINSKSTQKRIVSHICNYCER